MAKHMATGRATVPTGQQPPRDDSAQTQQDGQATVDPTTRRPAQPVGDTAEHAAYSEPLDRTVAHPAQAVGYIPVDGYVTGQVTLPDRKPRKKHHVVRNLLLLLLALALVYAGFAAASLERVGRDLQEAQSYAGNLESAAQTGDTDGILAAIHGLQTAEEDLSAETGGWVWTVGEHIPYLQDDVRSTRSLVSALDNVNDNALTPVLDDYQTATSDGATDEQRAQAAQDLVAQLQSAQGVIQQSLDEAQQASSSHSQRLNDAQEQLTDGLSSLNDGLTTLNDGLASFGSSAADALSSMLPSR